MSGVRSASLIFYFDIGSRYEKPEVAGVSHYLEHMLFKGTEQRPDAWMISEEIEGVGGMLNASTSKEATNYWCKCPSTHYDLAFDVLADMVRNSVIDKTELDKERSVIIEEIRGSEDSPEDYVHDIIDEVIWGTHSVGRSIAGSEETVGAISRDQMVSFWKRNYRPERLVIASGGDVQHDHVVELATNYFGAMAPDDNADRYDVAAVTQEGARSRIHTKETEQAHLCVGFPALPYTSDRRYVQGTIEAILSSGMSSRLFQEIREKRGLVYSVYGYFRPYEDVGQAVIYAGTDVARVDETVTAIVDELRKLRDIQVPEDELRRTKELRKGRLLMGLEDSRSVASWVGSQELVYGEIKTPEEVMEEIEAVTAEQVHELSQELFTQDKLNLALIGPYDDEAHFTELLAL
ncbi:MAG: insulinase family protein [Thermomicrobiales bacterium]|nr:insulinase family protein [Thermomicrobiales bacterium]